MCTVEHHEPAWRRAGSLRDAQCHGNEDGNDASGTGLGLSSGAGRLSFFGRHFEPESLDHRTGRLPLLISDRGMLVDVIHCGDKTTLDAIDISSVPIAIAHSNCRALNNHPA